MGNANDTQDQPQQQQKVAPHKRYVMELRDRQIIISYRQKKKLIIGDINFFPNDYQGLHLWDANVLLARFIYQNQELFQQKKVIELLSGTGISAITLKKYTKAHNIAATDRHQAVIENIQKNCVKNQITSGLIIAVLKWAEYEKYITKFDIVIGADLFFKDCPVALLIRAIDKLLVISGQAFLIQAEQADSSEQFLKLLQKENIFQYQKFQLIDEDYTQSPLLNQVQGFESFKAISQGKFYGLKITKIGEKEPVREENIKEEQPLQSQINQQNDKQEVCDKQFQQIKQDPEQIKQENSSNIQKEAEKVQQNQNTEQQQIVQNQNSNQVPENPQEYQPATQQQPATQIPGNNQEQTQENHQEQNNQEDSKSSSKQETFNE